MLHIDKVFDNAGSVGKDYGSLQVTRTEVGVGFAVKPGPIAIQHGVQELDNDELVEVILSSEDVKKLIALLNEPLPV